jgi:nitroreductase
MDVQEAVASRRSIRKFTSEPVPAGYVREMIEAARLAPSGCNAQPWKFYAVTDKDADTRKKFKTAQAFRQDFVYSAPVIIICCGQPDAYSGRHGGEQQIQEGSIPKDSKARAEMFSIVEGKAMLRTFRDVSIAAAFMVLRATELGLGTCFIGLINEPALHEVLGIPDDWVIPFTVIAGYPQGNVAQRPRKALEEIFASI